MPIKSRDDALEVERRIARIFAAPPDERAAAIRALFIEMLDFERASGQVSLASPPRGVELPASAERVAELDGVHVLYVALDTPGTQRVRRAEAAAAAKLIADQLGDDLLLVFTNSSASQLHVILPSFEGARPTLRRMIVERDLPRRTAMQQVSNIYWNYQESGSIRQALGKAFDVEAVTKAFFAEYKRVFDLAMARVQGFGSGSEETESKKLFVQTLFNRLMFIYFLSRKGWLTFEGDNDYLNALWRDHQSASGSGKDKNFHVDRLRLLFFAGLNNYRVEDLTSEPDADRLIGDVPFLNGGLFDMTSVDKRADIKVPDDCIAEIFASLFDKFNFTVMESTPYDIEVAVDPEMLGKVFEELVTGRHDSGSYYTPRPVVSFMCRESLKGYLESGDTGLAPSAIARFVDERDTSEVTLASAPKVAEALDEVSVVDPACGSGAYLLGMMQELIDLQSALFNVGVTPKGLYELKLHIIQRNLYGVDIDEFAANIAMLRLWLSLAIEYEGDKPEPLPNLDFKIVLGDSLLGPDPSPESYGDLFRHQVTAAASQLANLKAKYMAATTGKDALRKQIERVQSGLAAAVADSPAPAGSVDWRVQFAEVFARGGFDIAIANPPYVQLQGDGGRLGNLYRDAGYATYARTGDIYQLFYERGCQLLQADAGLLSYITSNSWLKAEYGKPLRRFFSERHSPLRLLELGKDVFQSAIVDSSVLILRTGERGGAFPAVDMDKAPDGSFPPREALWGQTRPDGDAPWSILSRLEQSAMDKMRARGTPLKEWDVKINRGILTGYNKAFIIDDATRRALVAEDPNSADIIKPILRGRDIQRYRANWAAKWLIGTHNGYDGVPAIDINRYPKVKAHLDSFYPQLERRQDKGNTPYNLRNCAYYEEFSKEKLFWMDMSPEARFAYSNTPVFSNDKGFILTDGPLKYLCAILNSSLITWMMKSFALTTGMGLMQWKKFAVERLPIPKLTAAKRRPFVRLVDAILKAKHADPNADTSASERDIDRLVYALYGLTEAERAAVEGSLGSTPVAG